MSEIREQHPVCATCDHYEEFSSDGHGEGICRHGDNAQHDAFESEPRAMQVTGDFYCPLHSALQDR